MGPSVGAPEGFNLAAVEVKVLDIVPGWQFETPHPFYSPSQAK